MTRRRGCRAGVRRGLALATSLLVLAVLPGEIAGQEVSARQREGPTLRGSVSFVLYYTGERSDLALPTGTSRYRALERVRLTAQELAPGLSFHTSFAIRQLEIGDLQGRDAIRLYQSYADYRKKGNSAGVHLQLGRHWVYGGGATGLTDGVSLAVESHRLRFGSFLGTLDPQERDLLRWPSLDRSRWWGLSAGLSPWSWVSLSASYSETRRADVNDGELLHAALEARPLRGVQLLYEHRYDFALDHVMGQSVLCSWRPDGRHEIWAEASRRRPELPASSFFVHFLDPSGDRAIDLSEHRRVELRGGGRTTVARDLELSTMVSAVDHGPASPVAPTGPAAASGWQAREPDDWSVDQSLNLSWRGQSVGYAFGRGYGGEKDAILASFNWRLSPQLRLGFDGNFLDYTYGRGVAVSDELVTLGGRLEADLESETSLSVRCELLNNRVSSQDFRFLFELRRGFHLGGQGKGESGWRF